MGTLTLLMENVKFEHTIFALPFAYLGTFLAAGGWPGGRVLLWVTLAMVAARTFAMTMNRILDLDLDARNPRTAARPLPSGRLSLRAAWGVALASAALFFLAAGMLNRLTLLLSPLALAIVTFYSLTKRFTWTTHFWLGLADGVAPMGGWLAVEPNLGRADPWLLALAVGFWIAGFDLIYACQDVEFDRAHGVHSIPARFGIAAALWTSRACHAAMIFFLAWLGGRLGLAWPYWVGLVGAAALLAYEQSLVKPDDLSKVNVAFFNVNGYLAVWLFLTTLGGIFLR